MTTILLPSLQQRPKKIYVVGLGITGLAAIASLRAAGCAVVAFDDNETNRQAASGVPLLDPKDWQASDGIDLLLLSPGIVADPSPHKQVHPAARRARELGVPISVDIDILFQEWRQQRDFIFITGTNGKSTTTKLTTHILAAAKNPRLIAMGGNIGAAALSLPRLATGGCYVLELSSYQLERMIDPVPTLAVLLNLSVDHLERHGTMAHYLHIKTRIFESSITGQRPQLSIIGVDDVYCRAYYEKNKERLGLVPISGLTLPTGGVGPRATQTGGQELIDDRGGRKLVVGTLPLHPQLVGPHNTQNIAATYLLANHYGIGAQQFRTLMQNFTPLRHRQEFIATISGVDYINDSKATNAQAALMSLFSFGRRPIYWLAGGELKQGDNLADLATAKAHITKGYFFGAGAQTLAKQLESSMAVATFANLATALTAAHHDAQDNAHHAESGKGAVVLLAPVGASFDQYKNFEERGDDFKNLV
ncbi:MAG: UDP-N-acetylmuramoyl-L-alanine--D-glutamate ligase, partial [Alphaproteobacteria bacterium]|nr:UDP-N-acetylmuramoyl-L-alanine--D-glutamate ligase [Alphaproteobacteria bacterium]